MPKKKYISILLFLCIYFAESKFAMSQLTEADYTTTLTHNYITAGLLLHTQGSGLSFRYGRHSNRTMYHYGDLDLLYIKHPKEIKIVNQVFEQAKPFVFGKMNSLLSVRASYGHERTIADRRELQGVKVNLNYSAGINLGLLKPVYLDIIKTTSEPASIYFSTEKYDPEKHSRGVINGGAGFFKGFNEIRMTPGLVIKTSISFEWSNHETDIRALETGIMFDIFSQEIPIFAFAENQSTFINLYLKYSIGRHW